MNPKAGEAGFTLVELLVASAVAASLVGLLSAATLQFVAAADRGQDRLAVLHDHGTAFSWLNRDAQMAVSDSSTVLSSSVTLRWTDFLGGSTFESAYAQSGSELVRTLTVNGTATSQTVARNLIPSGFSASRSGDLVTVSLASSMGDTAQTRSERVYMRSSAAPATPLWIPAPVACDLAATGGPSYSGGGKKVAFDITNNAASGTVSLQSISVTWDSAYGDLKKIKFDGSTVWDEEEAPPSASIGSLSGDLGAGQTAELRFEFKKNGHEGAVTFTATFSGGCTVGAPAPAACDLATSGGPSYSGGGKKVAFDITNSAASGTVSLQSISVIWDSAYGELKEIEFDGSEVWDDERTPPSASIGSLSGDLGAGQTAELRFEFKEDGDQGAVTFTATFSGGCTVGN